MASDANVVTMPAPVRDRVIEYELGAYQQALETAIADIRRDFPHVMGLHVAAVDEATGTAEIRECDPDGAAIGEVLRTVRVWRDGAGPDVPAEQVAR